jgi:hypothetical protein
MTVTGKRTVRRRAGGQLLGALRFHHGRSPGPARSRALEDVKKVLTE